MQFTKVVQLERDAAKIEGERGALVAAIAQSELKVLQVDEDMRAKTFIYCRERLQLTIGQVA